MALCGICSLNLSLIASKNRYKNQYFRSIFLPLGSRSSFQFSGCHEWQIELFIVMILWIFPGQSIVDILMASLGRRVGS